MSETGARLADRARELRAAFDTAFAEPLSAAAASTTDLLAFRIGSEPYALRLPEIAGLFSDRQITRLPSGVVAFMGLASLRGVVVPVYDLHVLLGRPPADAPRWLAMARDASVALAFEVFDGHLRTPDDAIAPSEAGDPSQRLVQGIASVEGLKRPIVSLPRMLEAIAERLPRTHSARE